MKKISDNRVINIKIYVDGRSEEIQDKLFELGCEWPVSGKCRCYTDSPFLYVNEDRKLSAGDKMTTFTRNGYREVKADEILAMEKMGKYRSIDGLKPFTKVLVRDYNDDPWDVGLFRKDVTVGIDGRLCQAYHTIEGRSYMQCIPYEGNEHMAFKVTE